MRPSINNNFLEILAKKQQQKFSVFFTSKRKIALILLIAMVSGFLPFFLLVQSKISDYGFAFTIYGAIILTILLSIFLLKLHRKRNILHKFTKQNEENLLNNLAHGLLRYDDRGKLIYISKSATNLFNCQQYELAGDGILEHIHILDRPLYLNSLKRSQYGEKLSINIRMRKNNIQNAIANYIWVEIEFTPLNYLQIKAAPCEVIVLLRDISEKKRKEEELSQKIKQAENSNKEKSQFLALIGHELRTPLNAIIGFSDMIINEVGGDLNPKYHEYISLISQSGHHLLSIVNSLLDMAKIEAGKFELNLTKFDPEQLISPALKIISKFAKEKNINIEVSKSAEFEQIIADERACLQIIINLLMNAIKFSKPASTVVLGLRKRGKYLEITVKDSGIGMDKEHLRRLGEPFFQADRGTNRKYEGTGLGISIVKGLVDLHQGTIHFESELNIGTNVTILLPLEGPKLNEDNIVNLGQITEKYFTPINNEQNSNLANNRKVAL